LRAVAAALVLVGCGAFEQDARPLPETTQCVKLEQRLTTFLQLLEDGRLDGLRSVTQRDFTADSRTRLIDALLKIIDALPPGTIRELSPLIDSGQLDQVAGTLGGVLGAVTEYEGLGIVGKLLEQCTGKPLLITLEELLSDEALLAEIETLGGVDIQLPIDLSKLENKAGFQALIRALITSISDSGFDVADIVAIVPQLESLLTALLAPGPRLESVQLVTRCLLQADPEDELAGTLFDIVRADLPAVSIDLYPGGTTETIQRIGLPLIRLLVADDTVRGSLVIGIAVLLRPKTAEKLVPDLVTLIQAGAVGELLDVLLTLAIGEC